MIETTLDPALHWSIFLIIGLAGGVACGMLGIGGGAVMVPALVLLAGYSQKSAQGTALAIIVPMALVAFLSYRFNPEISMDNRTIGLLIVAGVVGALIGSGIAARVPGPILKKVFAVFLIVVAFKMLLSSGGTARSAVPVNGNVETTGTQ